MSTKLDKIKEQIEYYLSDENLNIDDFFRKEISTHPDGYVSLNVFQKCNKIKKMGVTNEEILNSIKNSEKVEIDPTKNSIRRKNNVPLPEFKESNKKVKTDNNNNHHKKEEEKKEEPEEPEKYEPLVFAIVAENNDVVDWKIIQKELEIQTKEKIYYTRYSKEDKIGHFVVNKFTVDEAKKENFLKNGLKIETALFKIELLKDKELESFWKEHGGHYTLCIERNHERVDKNRKKDRKTQKNERKEREKHAKNVEISLASRKYSDPSKVKSIFKNLLNTSPNGEIISEPNHTMLVDILKFHDNGEKKLEKLKHFIVDIHPEHKNTRCFFVVREDGTKEDFSIQKCLDKIMNKDKPKK